MGIVEKALDFSRVLIYDENKKYINCHSEFISESNFPLFKGD